MAEEEDGPTIPVEEICRVCGLGGEGALWNEYGVPQYLICPCCGTESGVEDETYGRVRASRALWLASGGEWKEPEYRPSDWSLEEQLAQIPAEWR